MQYDYTHVSQKHIWASHDACVTSPSSILPTKASQKHNLMSGQQKSVWHAPKINIVPILALYSLYLQRNSFHYLSSNSKQLSQDNFIFTVYPVNPGFNHDGVHLEIRFSHRKKRSSIFSA